MNNNYLQYLFYKEAGMRDEVTPIQLKRILSKLKNIDDIYYEYNLISCAYNFKINKKSISFKDALNYNVRIPLNSKYKFTINCFNGIYKTYNNFKYDTYFKEKLRRHKYTKFTKKVTITRRGDKSILVSGTFNSYKDILSVIRIRGYNKSNIEIHIKSYYSIA